MKHTKHCQGVSLETIQLCPITVDSFLPSAVCLFGILGVEVVLTF